MTPKGQQVMQPNKEQSVTVKKFNTGDTVYNTRNISSQCLVRRIMHHTFKDIPLSDKFNYFTEIDHDAAKSKDYSDDINYCFEHYIVNSSSLAYLEQRFNLLSQYTALTTTKSELIARVD